MRDNEDKFNFNIFDGMGPRTIHASHVVPGIFNPRYSTGHGVGVILSFGSCSSQALMEGSKIAVSARDGETARA